MKKVYLVALLFGLLLSACSASGDTSTGLETPGVVISVPGGEYRDISVPELQEMLQDRDFTFVNVHIPFEGDIPDTDLSIPFDEIESHLDELPADKNAKIVLYCRSDRMSGISSETLVSLGYTNIWNLDGGFNAWEAAGLPLEGR
jgi:rhodanese-related sulfurtransferase